MKFHRLFFGRNMKEYDIKIGEIVFRFCTEKTLEIEPELIPFLIEGKANPEVKILVRWDYEMAEEPKTPMAGQDLIQNYYIEETVRFCETKGGKKGPVALVVYSERCDELQCFINGSVYQQRYYSLGWILRLLPMREIFQRFGVIFFHAAQIALGDQGILFTAPSETGKSTQASLWEEHEMARILCGDRTLVREIEKQWRGYGYPVDGSSPVRSTETTKLCAVVLLEQAKENRIEKLKGIKGAAHLMPQLVIDGWSVEARQRGIELLLALQGEVPFYRLFCTPDKKAVEVLKRQLIEDGMIEDGKNQGTLIE